jgi:pilus assembly protein Flp/PilA
MEGDMVTGMYARLQLAWYGLWRRAREQSGATAVEYALMLALIAVVIVGAVTLLGNNTSSAYANPTLNSAIGGS